MADYARSEDFKTPECRVSYAKGLWVARAQQEGGKEKFGATLIFPKTCDRSTLDAAVRHCIVETWGDKGLERAKAGMIKSPFLDGAGKEARNKKTGELHPGMGEDKFFIRVSTLYEPTVLYRSKNVPAQHGSGSDQVKSGDYGKAVINAFAWHDDRNGDGVSFGILMFQKLREGESLGGTGGPDVDKYFETIEGDAAPETTKTGDGASSLFG